MGCPGQDLHDRGQERALLRMLGVTGLDRSGRPLAAEVVDRYVGGRPDRLAGGVILPFAAALLEYEPDSQDLALDSPLAPSPRAGGRVLRDRERRPAVEATARALGLSALDRIDANRTARLELLAVIGGARQAVGRRRARRDRGRRRVTREAGTLAAAGVDVIQVSVPAIRELADRLHDEASRPVLAPRPSPGSGGTATEVQAEPAPAGSQRGLAELRQAVDAAAAERRALPAGDGGAAPWPHPSRPSSRPSSGSTSSRRTSCRRSSMAT